MPGSAVPNPNFLWRNTGAGCCFASQMMPKMNHDQHHLSGFRGWCGGQWSKFSIGWKGIWFAGQFAGQRFRPYTSYIVIVLSPPHISNRIVVFTLTVVLAGALPENATTHPVFCARPIPAWAQETGDSNWRRTSQGWVNSNRWNRPARVEFERRIELVHPLAFSALIVLFSLGMLIWASEEAQWSQVTQSSRNGWRRRPPDQPQAH